jgi:putative SOS response-associated peptidase YedK
MCGRDYSTYTGEELYFRYISNKQWPWKADDKLVAVNPNYNMCPSQEGPVLCVQDGILTFKHMRWGLVPGWAKSVQDADKYSMINAKAEEISEKRSYKAAFQRRRCIVPISGFYEWKKDKDGKKPFAIHLKETPIMSVAGIWESWQDKENKKIVESFAILTTSSNSFMENIHTRMPVILSEEEEQSWLDPANNEISKLNILIKGCASEVMTAFPVSTKVNSPKNNSPDNLVLFNS